ncbi:MAG: type II toxin-antitoxin system VapC family toxin [Solimonas sp.]
MRLLLDTHVLLWAMNVPKRLNRKTIALLNRAEVFVSAASVWEISIKAALGKIKVEPQRVLEALEPAGFDLLSVDGPHAVEVFSLGAHHGDPFDRLLVAQAKCERMTLLTSDETLLAYGSFVQMAE